LYCRPRLSFYLYISFCFFFFSAMAYMRSPVPNLPEEIPLNQIHVGNKYLDWIRGKGSKKQRASSATSDEEEARFTPERKREVSEKSSTGCSPLQSILICCLVVTAVVILAVIGVTIWYFVTSSEAVSGSPPPPAPPSPAASPVASPLMMGGNLVVQAPAASISQVGWWLDSDDITATYTGTPYAVDFNANYPENPHLVLQPVQTYTARGQASLTIRPTPEAVAWTFTMSISLVPVQKAALRVSAGVTAELHMFSAEILHYVAIAATPIPVPLPVDAPLGTALRLEVVLGTAAAWNGATLAENLQRVQGRFTAYVLLSILFSCNYLFILGILVFVRCDSTSKYLCHCIVNKKKRVYFKQSFISASCFYFVLFVIYYESTQEMVKFFSLFSLLSLSCESLACLEPRCIRREPSLF